MGVRSRVLGASEGHTSRVACRAIGPQGVCGASTWSHTMLETSGTGPSDQGSFETTIPVTGPFTPGSGFRGRHGTRTCLAQQRSPLNATDKNGPLTEPRSLSPSYGGLSPGHGPIHQLLASRLCKMHARPPRCLKAPRSCSPPPRPLRLPSIFSVFEDKGQYPTVGN